MKKDLNELGFLKRNLIIREEVYVDQHLSYKDSEIDSMQTANAFSVKWDALKEDPEVDQERWKCFQKEWYLKLYGFEKENNLKDFLQDKRLIIDAGCGQGYKAAWFANLLPNQLSSVWIFPLLYLRHPEGMRKLKIYISSSRISPILH